MTTTKRPPVTAGSKTDRARKDRERKTALWVEREDPAKVAQEILALRGRVKNVERENALLREQLARFTIRTVV